MASANRISKGEETRKRILEAATDILLQDGYKNFVFRSVAERAGVKPGNVQYYFSRKRDLLWAVLRPELENYLDRLGEELLKGKTPEEKIDRMVRYLISDISTEETLRLWLSIWEMAVHDREIYKTVNRFYRSYIDALSKLLMQVYPELDADQAEEAATSMTAYIDGLMVVLQIGKPRRKSVAAVKRHIDATVTRIINAG